MFYDAVLRNRKMSKYCYLCGKVEQLDVFGSPKDPSIRAKWFAFCNVDEEYHSTMQTLRLCEKHFKEEEICRKKTPNGRSKLKKFVEPSQTRERLRKEAKVTNTLGHCQICTRSGLLKSERSYSSKISNFCFPKDAALREKWLHFCELEEEELPSDPRLCSLHFHPDEIVKHSPLKWGLATGAVPILYDIEGAADFSDTCAIEQSLESVEHEVVQSTDLISESGVEEMIEIVENCDGSSSCSAQSDMEDLIEIVRDDNTSTDYLADSILDNEPVTSPFCFSETCIRDAISVLFVLYYIWCLMISTGCSKTSFVNEDILRTPGTNTRNPDTVSPNTSPNSRPKRKCSRTLRYLGDVRSPDFKSPTKSKRIYEIATAAINKYRKRSILLQKQNSWLQKRMQNYRQMITDLKAQLLISEKRAFQ